MNEEILEKPTPPADGECCDSACSPCVWDTFYEKRRQWRIQQAELKAKQQDDEKT